MKYIKFYEPRIVFIFIFIHSFEFYVFFFLKNFTFNFVMFVVVFLFTSLSYFCIFVYHVNKFIAFFCSFWLLLNVSFEVTQCKNDGRHGLEGSTLPY